MSGEVESVERREFLEAGKEKRELEKCQKMRREDEDQPWQFPDMNTIVSTPPPNTMRFSRVRTVSPFHEALSQRLNNKQTQEKTLAAQVCPFCPDFSTKAPNHFHPGGTGQSPGHCPHHCLYLQLLLPLQASETSLVRALGACPRLTLCWQAQEDGAAPTCTSWSPRVPG